MRAAGVLLTALLVLPGCFGDDPPGTPNQTQTAGPDAGANPGPSASTTPSPAGSPGGGTLTLPGDAGSDNETAPSVPCTPAPARRTTANVTVDPQGITRMAVPLDVVLVGFPEDVATRLQQALVPLTVPDIHAAQPELGPAPGSPALDATVVFEVHRAPDVAAGAFQASVRPAPEDPDFLDGNAAEDVLAAILSCAVLPVSADLPALVIVHLGDDHVGDHLWMYRAEAKPEPDDWAGWVRGIRTFGGREPFIVFDASASKDTDSYYVAGDRGFEAPHALGDASLVDDLREAVVTAAGLRFFPRMGSTASIAPCATLSIVYGIRAASLGDGSAMMLDPGRQIHPDRIRAEFEALTGRPVTVDMRTLSLPADDPAFDALTRMVGAAFVAFQPASYTSPAGIYEPLPPATQDARSQALDQAIRQFGAWVDLVWDEYVRPGPGCDGYLGLMVWADAADYPQNYGVGPSTPAGHRYSLGSMGVFERFIADPGPAPSPYSRAPWQGSYDIADTLLTHEFGHNFGLPHPHLGWGGSGTDWSFSGDRTVMSYRWSGLSGHLGPIDHATVIRIRAGAAIQDAALRGTLDGPAGVEALAALEAWDWQRAADVLLPPA